MSNLYPPGTPLGPFTIERAISQQGKMAIVYEVSVGDITHPSELGRRLALKIARIEERILKKNVEIGMLYEDALLKEVRLLRQLHHPNVVRVFPVASNGRRVYWRKRGKTAYDTHESWYFAMELLSDSTLSAVYTPRENQSFVPFPLPWKVELIYQIAQTLDYLHMRGLAHRDLKPSNIIFRTPPDSRQMPTPVLVDFGISDKRSLRRKVSDADNNNREIMMGTVPYAPPEWIERRRHSGSTSVVSDSVAPSVDNLKYDMWSLGIISYMLITDGRHPFGDYTGTRIEEFEERILRNRRQPFPPEIAQDYQVLCDMVYMMLEPDPNKRLTIEGAINWINDKVSNCSPLAPPRV